MDILAQNPITMALGKSNLFAGTTTTLSTSNAVAYAIRSKAYSLAQQTNTASPTTDANTGEAFVPVPANYGCLFMIGVNAAGSLQAVQGGQLPLDASGAFINAPQFPALPTDFCPIGYLVTKAGPTASSSPGWTFGSSNWAGVTGVTNTFVSAISVPDRPQIS